MHGVAAPKKAQAEPRELTRIAGWRQHDRKDEIDAIVREHDRGIFHNSAVLVDEVMTDDRLYGVFQQRLAGITSKPIAFKPAGKRRKEIKAAQRWGGDEERDTAGIWNKCVPLENQQEFLKWGLMLGMAFGPIRWQRTAGEWTPRVTPWHPMHARWDQNIRRFVVRVEQGYNVVLPDPEQEPNGDGKFFIWCPYGFNGGWLSGLIRPVAQLYLERGWLRRDWSRYDEVRGMGILKVGIPTGVFKEETEEEAFVSQFDDLGSESVVTLPLGSDKESKDTTLDLVEPTGQASNTFEKHKGSIDVDLAVLILGQNLTTEISDGGSRAAAQEHSKVRADLMVKDAGLYVALRERVLTWDAEYNFGDAELAPYVEAQIEPPTDEKDEATSLKMIGDAALALYTAEPRTDIEAIYEQFGVPMRSQEEVDAEQEAQMEAQAEAAAAAGGDEGGAGGGEEEKKPGRAELSGGKAEPKAAKRYTFAGLPIAIEHPAGSVREWVDADGKRGETRMRHDYGFIEGYLSGDGEELDVYIGPDEGARHVHVVHQAKAPKFTAYDEDKVMLGFWSADAARAGYVAHRNDGERAILDMTTMPLERFKAKLKRRSPEATTKIRASVQDARTRTTLALERLIARSRTKLSRNTAGRRRASDYADKLMASGRRAAVKALASLVSDMAGEVEKTRDLADLRAKIVERLQAASGAERERLATAVYRVNLLAKLLGMAEADDQQPG